MNPMKPKAVLKHLVEPCQCGGMKSKGARHCFSCRYSVPSQSKEPERITKESMVAALDPAISNDWLRKPLMVSV